MNTENRQPLLSLGKSSWSEFPQGDERNTDRETSYGLVAANAVSDNLGESRSSDASRLDQGFSSRFVIVFDHVLPGPVNI